MNPGPELDRLIAERIFDEDLSFHPADKIEDGILPGKIFYDIQPEPDPYSTDIALAWSVLDKIQQDTRFKADVRLRCIGNKDKWIVTFRFGSNSAGPVPLYEEVAEGVSAPHAICLAALQVIEK